MAEIKGQIIGRMPDVTGQGAKGPWSKTDFIIETLGPYPKKVAFTAWNDKAKPVKAAKKGDILIVQYEPESKESKGRWYTELRAGTIEIEGETPVYQPKAQRQNAAPARRQTYDNAYADENRYNDNSGNPDEELPF